MNPKRLVILEGCDGAGKSTLAAQLRDLLSPECAEYPVVVEHFGYFGDVSAGLARMYVEATLPALHGYAPVILDRSWLSEQPYSDVYRDGKVRIDKERRRMLERLMLRCDPLVVHCCPPFSEIEKSIAARATDDEYERDMEKVRRVYDHYDELLKHSTFMDVVTYDWTKQTVYDVLALFNQAKVPTSFGIEGLQLDVPGAGAYTARTLVVTPDEGEPGNHDPLIRWPLASFGGAKAVDHLYYRFASILDDHGTHEKDLWWIQASEMTAVNMAKIIAVTNVASVVAMGDDAVRACKAVSPYGKPYCCTPVREFSGVTLPVRRLPWEAAAEIIEGSLK